MGIVMAARKRKTVRKETEIIILLSILGRFLDDILHLIFGKKHLTDIDLIEGKNPKIAPEIREIIDVAEPTTQRDTDATTCLVRAV